MLGGVSLFGEALDCDVGGVFARFLRNSNARSEEMYACWAFILLSMARLDRAQLSVDPCNCFHKLNERCDRPLVRLSLSFIALNTTKK